MKTLRRIILQAMDMYWIEHLEVMDYMRSSVNLRAYGQRDPLVEYKREGLKLFKEMEIAIVEEIKKLIPQIKSSEIFFDAPVKLTEILEGAQNLTTEKAQSSQSLTPRTSEGEKIGRNDPCFCGAKKPDGTSIKYKNCHGHGV